MMLMKLRHSLLAAGAAVVLVRQLTPKFKQPRA